MADDPGSAASDPQLKQGSFFSKSLKKISSKASRFNLNSALAESSDSTYATSSAHPFKSVSTQNSLSGEAFQAIGYESVSDSVGPTHVRVLPRRDTTKSKHTFVSSTNSLQRSSFSSDEASLWNRKTSNGDSSSYASVSYRTAQTGFPSTSNEYPGAPTYELFNASFSSLDPKDNNSTVDLMTGLKNPSIKETESSPKLGAAFVYDSFSPPLPQYSTELKEDRKSAKSSPNAPKSSFLSVKRSTSSRNLQSYKQLAANAMPRPSVVDALFERLLSSRVFPEQAFQNITVQRKWELLLSENENNASFDLRHLTNQVSASVSQRENSPTIPTESPRIVKDYPLFKSAQQINHQLQSKILEGNDTDSHTESGTLSTLSKKFKMKDGSASWYVTRIMSNKLTIREYRKLSKKLESRSSQKWMDEFHNAQGTTALSVVLQRINKRSIKSNDDIDIETYICHCLKSLISNQPKVAVYEQRSDVSSKSSVSNQEKVNKFVIEAIIHSLLSPRASTRLLVTEILIYFIHDTRHNYSSLIINGFVNLQDSFGIFDKFQPWLDVFENSIDSHSESMANSKNDNDHKFETYILTTIIFINSLINTCANVKERVDMRKELHDCRLHIIFEKLRSLDSANISSLVDNYENFEEDDYSDLYAKNQLKDFDDDYESNTLGEVFSKLKLRFDEDSLDEPYEEMPNSDKLKSFLYNLTLLKSTKSSRETDRILDLLDSVVVQLTSGLGIDGSDTSHLNSALQRLMDRMETDETARRAVMETIQLKRKIEELTEEKRRLEVRLLQRSTSQKSTAPPTDPVPRVASSTDDSAPIHVVKREKNSLDSSLQVFRDEHAKMKESSKQSSPRFKIKYQHTGGSPTSANSPGKKSSGHRHRGAQVIEHILGESNNYNRRAEYSDSGPVKRPLTPPLNHIFKPEKGLQNQTLRSDHSSQNMSGSTIAAYPEPQIIDVDDEDSDEQPEPVPNQDVMTKPELVAPTALHPAHQSKTAEKDLPPTPSIQEISSEADSEQSSQDPISISAPQVPPAAPGSSEPSAATAPLPPPPPPLPSLLTQSKPSTFAPPPPPPPLPSLLTQTKTGGANPPPPPPLPSLLTQAKSAGSNPPTPPPLPNLLAPSNAAPGAPVPPPAPPLAPPIPYISASPNPETMKKHPLYGSSEYAHSASNLMPGAEDSNGQLIRPKNKLKQMHWSKLEAIDKTFWNDISSSVLIDKLQEKGVLEEVEKAFVAKVSVMKKKVKDVNSSNIDSSQPVSLLPRDLAQQFGINLHMFSNLSVESLIQKVLVCDKEIMENTSVLEFFNSDALNEIPDSVTRSFMPYATDFTRPDKVPSKNASQLDRPDRIYLEIFNMRGYWKSRSRALLLVHTYQKDFHDLLQKLDLVDKAITCIKNSDGLKQILAIIRSVGNFMNDSSKQAMGFKLDILQRLKFMKDETNSKTFLHYIEQIVRNNFPEFGLFVDELSILNHLQKIAIDQIEAACIEYQTNISNIMTSLSKGNLSMHEMFHPDDQILEVLKRPLERARDRSSSLTTHTEHTLKNFHALMEYFGENHEDAASKNSFFLKFNNFVNEFKKAHAENVQKEEDERAYERKKEMIERRERERLESRESAKKRAQSEGQDEDIGDEEDEVGDMEDEGEEGEAASEGNHHTDTIDDLMRQLKNNTPLHEGSAANRRSNRMRPRSLRPLSMEIYGKENFQITRREKTAHEYESVQSLKRRMTTRKKAQGVAEEESDEEKDDTIMLRAQTMLSELRHHRRTSSREKAKTADNERRSKPSGLRQRPQSRA